MRKDVSLYALFALITIILGGCGRHFQEETGCVIQEVNDYELKTCNVRASWIGEIVRMEATWEKYPADEYSDNPPLTDNTVRYPAVETSIEMVKKLDTEEKNRLLEENYGPFQGGFETVWAEGRMTPEMAQTIEQDPQAFKLTLQWSILDGTTCPFDVDCTADLDADIPEHVTP